MFQGGFDLNQSYPVLPPVGSASASASARSDPSPPPQPQAPLDEKGLERRAGQLLKDTTDRSFDTCLISLRKADKDRDRVVSPHQLETLLEKHKVGSIRNNCIA